MLAKSELEKIEGEVVNIIYENEDNGYKVVEIENKTDFFVAVGYLHGVSVGEFVILTGSWINHNVYGEQFKAEIFEKKLPNTRESIYKYLSSGIIKGVRSSTASKIIEYFGEDSLDVIANNPLRLAQIKGISKDKALSIQKSYNEQVGASSLVMFLQRYNISINFAAKIYKIYGSASIELIQANPYILCEDIDGISFKTSDRIADGLNIAADNIMRLRAGTVYTLRYNTQFGHSFLPRKTLCELSSQLLGVDSKKVDETINLLVKDKSFVLQEFENVERVYCYAHYMCEENVAKKLCQINRVIYDFKEDDIRRRIDIVEKTQQMELAQLQREAVSAALKNSVLVITGGPGTGKTTIINAIIDVMSSNGLSVTLTAPTGRAAKRMSQVCHTEAKTIHRLLEAGYHDETNEIEFAIGEDKPIETDVLIIDEMSSDFLWHKSNNGRRCQSASVSWPWQCA